MDDLIAAAREVRARAYAPYSRYNVGAAVRGADGRVYTGVNFENLSYGATICAERAAIGTMVTAGCTRLDAVAVATADGGTPCGICLQVLREFAPDPHAVEVATVDEGGTVRRFKLADLMPHAFTTERLQRNGPAAGESE